MGMKIGARAVSKKLARYPGEWVILDGESGRVVAHDESFGVALRAMPKSTKKPTVYFSPRTDGAEMMLTTF